MVKVDVREYQPSQIIPCRQIQFELPLDWELGEPRCQTAISRGSSLAIEGAYDQHADVMSAAVQSIPNFIFVLLHVASRRSPIDHPFVFSSMDIDEDEGFSDNPASPHPQHSGTVRTSTATAPTTHEGWQTIMNVSHLDRAQKGGECELQCYFSRIVRSFCLF